MTARYIIADVFEALATLPDNSVDLVFSSPPFLALRSYLPQDHPDKGKEIGSEATPADFLDTLLDVVEACDRVLAPHGSLCFELGDTYAGSGGRGGDYAEGGMREGQPGMDGSAARKRVGATERQTAIMLPHEPADDGKHQGNRLRDRRRVSHNGNKNRDNAPGWPLDKSLCGLPTLFAWSLAYGRNLLRPERTTPRWRIRNVVVWARPNPPVGALGDKFRPATSYLTVACKSDKRWFDLDAVRTEHKPHTLKYDNRAVSERGSELVGDRKVNVMKADTHQANPAGAPPLDYWEIPTQPYAGSHYATFPDKLVVRPVKAMCPSKVCRVCGEPSRRITAPTEEYDAHKTQWSSADAGLRNAKPGDGGVPAALRSNGRGGMTAQNETLGWTDCGHNDWRNGVVLEPFAGSGTTLSVATGHGRDAIGIDLDSRNAELALERVGPLFLTVEKLGDQASA